MSWDNGDFTTSDITVPLQPGDLVYYGTPRSIYINAPHRMVITFQFNPEIGFPPGVRIADVEEPDDADLINTQRLKRFTRGDRRYVR